jgi:hypothetical protein
MPDETNALQRAAERTAREADRLSALFSRQLAAVFRDAERRIREVLATHPRITPAMRTEIRGTLRVSGFDALAVVATREPFDDIAARVLRNRAIEASRLEPWRLWHQEDLRDEGAVVSRSLSGAVMRSAASAKAFRRLPQQLGDILEHAEARVQTLYDTAVSIYGRQVEAEAAGDDAATVFAYMGPVDAKTRDFCLGHVGRVYTRAEIDTLDNGQLSNVFLTGGGYNCRHVWHEISKFSELYPLKGTSQRAPEIMEMVREVRKAA